MSFSAALAARPLVLDGGLATELEHRGHRLDDALWSARLLIDAPDSIAAVHYDFYAAGARCVTTASYQASHRGFAAAGIPAEAATSLLEASVRIAVEARARYQREHRHAPSLFVAASVGPYGATLHDGSEYRGDYDMSEGELTHFHVPRLDILAGAGADVLACETLPLLREARAIISGLANQPGRSAWVTFTSADGSRTSGGDPLGDCGMTFDDHPQVVAIGVNCLRPELVAASLRALRRGTDKPLVVYPNVAGTWDAHARTWSRPVSFDAVLRHVPEWLDLGARAIGGCCGTRPADIRALANHLDNVGVERL